MFYVSGNSTYLHKGISNRVPASMNARVDIVAVKVAV